MAGPEPELLAPSPLHHVRFALDSPDSSPSPSPTPSAHSSTIQLIPPPAASPLSTSAFTNSESGPSSARTSLLDRYSEDDNAEPSSSSYARTGSSSTPYYPPKPLASNISSREAQFDADGDDFDSDGDHEAPLIEGLVHTRKSLDLRAEQRRLSEMESDIESGQQPEWLTRGGGIWAGIANMSNSIMGAGIVGAFFVVLETVEEKGGS